MFRELTRKNKEISREECITLLTEETRGILSVNGDNGYPYSSPMNHYYDPCDECIYFHCGKSGHRIDSLKKDGKVCFTLYNKGEIEYGEWAYTVKSVVVFGKIEIVDDEKTIKDIAIKLSHKFTLDDSYINKEIKAFLSETLLLKLKPEHICGKKIKES